jgi:NADH-quinone oxidoreductase subunit J
MPVTGNTEQVGWLLYTSYLIPFEIASMLLLVAMIGAIVLAKAAMTIESDSVRRLGVSID